MDSDEEEIMQSTSALFKSYSKMLSQTVFFYQNIEYSAWKEKKKDKKQIKSSSILNQTDSSFIINQTFP
jgi:hypothetical protein